MTDPNPAPMQPAPSPDGGGARVSPNWIYRCEVCGDPVEVDYAEAVAETEGRNHRPPLWGVIIRCEEHRLPGKPAKPEPVPHQSEVRARPVMRPREFPPIPGPRFNLDLTERMDYGVTVTIRNVDGDRDTLVGVGPVVTALTDVCRRVDTLNILQPAAEWRVVTVSTPATIYTDLQGHRDPDGLHPETKLLAFIGRRDHDSPHPFASRSGRPPSPL